MSERSVAVLHKELHGIRAAGNYDFDQLYRFAQICQASGLFEDVTDAAQAFVKIAKGQELGFPPTTAMTAFDIIRKRLFMKPWAIAAKINSCGYGAFRVVTQTAEECTIVFRRRTPDRGWEEYPPVHFTYAEAKAHGLADRSAHWKASPAHMLYQRCLGRGGLMYFPELLAGLEIAPSQEPISPGQHQKNITDLFGDQDGAQATMPPSRQASPEERKEDWRKSVHTLAFDLLDFLDGSQAPEVVAHVQETVKQAQQLVEDPETNEAQGIACRTALVQLGDELAKQLGLPI